jgi:putative aminopeptidase FrvX
LSNLGHTLSSAQRSLHKYDELYKQESVKQMEDLVVNLIQENEMGIMKY